MPDWPTVPLFCFLFVVAVARAGATYAVGRGARSLTERSIRLRERPAVQDAERLVTRYGAPAVSLCFLTVGVQTAVNAAAGGLRMPLRRYVPALCVGAVIWATIYVTVGLAVLEAVWGGRWELLLAVLFVAATVGWLVRRWFLRREPSELE